MGKITPDITFEDAAAYVATCIGLFLLISFVVSAILCAINILLFLATPLIAGVVALVYFIKMLIGVVRCCRANNLPARNAFIVGALIIAAIETGYTLWMIYEIERTRWW